MEIKIRRHVILLLQGDSSTVSYDAAKTKQLCMASMHFKTRTYPVRRFRGSGEIPPLFPRFLFETNDRWDSVLTGADCLISVKGGRKAVQGASINGIWQGIEIA
jgi:hypothetical protein